MYDKADAFVIGPSPSDRLTADSDVAFSGQIYRYSSFIRIIRTQDRKSEGLNMPWFRDIRLSFKQIYSQLAFAFQKV